MSKVNVHKGPEVLKSRQVIELPIEYLKLDERNPRFGEDYSGKATQTDILNNIVKNYGVTDVLSSIAINGYFSAEPMVVKKINDKEYTVMEGNRRLSACLILIEDDRARDQIDIFKSYIKNYHEHGSHRLQKIPAIVFEGAQDNKPLVSYLGVRHIVSTKDWDSYAKAAWISRTVNDGEMSISDISSMIGDKHNTIKRLLQGFNFVKQLEKSGKYTKEDSVKKGRGSNSAYPFSWVYTLLGYKSVQDFVQLSSEEKEIEPINSEKLDNAKLLMTAMFGDKRTGKNSQVNDSRKLGLLAEIVSSEEKVRYLKSGKNVDEIQALSKPTEERIIELMFQISDHLEECHSRVIKDKISKETAVSLSERLDQLSRQFSKFRGSINDVIIGKELDGEF
ncbi:hypothetical protein AM379_18550 [Enterobacter cloacae complex sp. FDA-CDC-AR_0132]|uniref:hypothetical protein n=1 Tax=Enterobacter cloacae complex TaxID=354276 RepID=UPI000D0AF3B6|nr:MULTISPECIES: hypothetical protein [Enterobacter cloacae complex]AVP02283.1 hypothetical protein AM379_18550 [Enterobacter cloacae complex sp. FDA-CDC-AR_0132]MBQ0225273.1 hypothetical protein [Enterobacter ludwigii]